MNGQSYDPRRDPAFLTSLVFHESRPTGYLLPSINTILPFVVMMSSITTTTILFFYRIIDERNIDISEANGSSYDNFN